MKIQIYVIVLLLPTLEENFIFYSRTRYILHFEAILFNNSVQQDGNRSLNIIFFITIVL